MIAKLQSLAEDPLREAYQIRQKQARSTKIKEVGAILDAAIKATNATSSKEMGQVMAVVKPQVVGRADMGKLSALIKQKLG